MIILSAEGQTIDDSCLLNHIALTLDTTGSLNEETGSIPSHCDENDRFYVQIQKSKLLNLKWLG